MSTIPRLIRLNNRRTLDERSGLVGWIGGLRGDNGWPTWVGEHDVRQKRQGQGQTVRGGG